jgi:hypothetical protein
MFTRLLFTLAFLFALLSGLVPSTVARAATIATDGTNCTLVDAITAANTDTAVGGCAAGSGADIITLAGVYTLTAALPAITSAITIEGNGATIQRASSAPQFQFFVVAKGSSLTLNRVTLTGGSVPGFGAGGAIYNLGTLTVNNSVITGNRAWTRGGIYNNGGTATLNSVVVSNNTADNGGGGIGNVHGSVTVVNSTISGNTSPGAAGISNYGGTLTIINSTISGNSGIGIENNNLDDEEVGNLTLRNVTITGNTSDGVASSQAPAITTIQQSLIAGNAANEINASNGMLVNTNGYNLIGFGGSVRSSNFTPAGTDIVPTVSLSAILDSTLRNNGGSTPTHALTSGSLAIDGAPTGPATDQRGVSRPQGAAFDIGAFEVEQATFVFSGFFQPIDNLPTVNSAKAGSSVPVKFSLGDNYGLNIFAAGYPKPQQIACSSGAPTDEIEQTAVAGVSSLSYEAASGQYNYTWKTDKSWAGTCRQLVVRLVDGTEHVVSFRFK